MISMDKLTIKAQEALGRSQKLAGDHGHLSRHRAVCPMLVAAGAGVPRAHRPAMEALAVRGLVEGLLGAR